MNRVLGFLLDSRSVCIRNGSHVHLLFHKRMVQLNKSSNLRTNDKGLYVRLFTTNMGGGGVEKRSFSMIFRFLSAQL